MDARATAGVIKYLNPIHIVVTLQRHSHLIWQFARRDVEGRYRGSFLGVFWSLINPLALLSIYTFVFGVVFRARWPEARQGSLADFALVMFCGFIPFNLFAECLTRAPALVVAVPNYVKKVVFPLEILPVAMLGSATFHAGASLIVLVVASALVRGGAPTTLVLLPLVALPLLLLSLGAAFFLSSLGVFLRDIGYLVTLALQVLLFGTPIFYPAEVVPAEFRALIGLNPLASVVDNLRRVVMWGTPPDWTAWALSTFSAGALVLLGYAWFMKTKLAFADVI